MRGFYSLFGLCASVGWKFDFFWGEDAIRKLVDDFNAKLQADTGWVIEVVFGRILHEVVLIESKIFPNYSRRCAAGSAGHKHRQRTDIHMHTMLLLLLLLLRVKYFGSKTMYLAAFLQCFDKTKCKQNTMLWSNFKYFSARAPWLENSLYFVCHNLCKRVLTLKPAEAAWAQKCCKLHCFLNMHFTWKKSAPPS